MIFEIAACVKLCGNWLISTRRKMDGTKFTNLFAFVEIQRQLPEVVSFYVSVKQAHTLIFLIDLCVNFV